MTVIDYKKKRTYLPHNFGWIDTDKFMIGSDLITKAGPIKYQTSHSIPSKLKHDLQSNGDINKQINLTKLFSDERMFVTGFIYAIGYAVPLFRYARLSGFNVCLGGSTGSGKTSSVACLNSIYGHSQDLVFQRSSPIYILNMACVLKNFAVCVENFDMMTVSQQKEIISTISTGSYFADGYSQKIQTCLVCTSHESLFFKKTQPLKNMFNKYLEIFIPEDMKLFRDVDFSKKFHTNLKENYGNVGRVYMEGVIKNQLSIISEIERKLQKTENNFDARFLDLNKLLCCCSVGLGFAKKLGLIKFDQKVLLEYVYEKAKTFVDEASRMRYTENISI